MSLENLYNKLQLLNLKDSINKTLGEDIPEHDFIEDAGFNRIILMWELVKDNFIINMAYEYYNGILTFKTQVKLLNVKHIVSKNFSFSINQTQNQQSVVRFSVATVEACINQILYDFKDITKELTKTQKKVQKNG